MVPPSFKLWVSRSPWGAQLRVLTKIRYSKSHFLLKKHSLDPKTSFLPGFTDDLCEVKRLSRGNA
ncbi:MAG TPA: hypothetical protein DGU45_05095 [Planctomycetes bacterium]|nr:hypothetical protein [Planctomycetota bacterium]